MYVYIQSEPGLWTVGFYDPAGQWHGDSDHNIREDAAKRVAWLNGSSQEDRIARLETLLEEHEAGGYKKLYHGS